jgi:hypothetical protein
MSKIVVSGNPVDGLWFTGPFSGAEVAAEWAESHYNPPYDWWIADMESPSYDKRPDHSVTPIDSID